MVTHLYGLEVNRGTLRVQERTAAGAVRSREILRGVASWECDLDEETGILAIRLEGRDGRGVARRYRVP